MSVNFEVATESPALDAAIVDPQHWADERWLHEQFAWLRNHAPIRRMAPDGVDPFWSIARHADILAIEGNKRLFLNDPRPILAPKLLESVIQHLSGRRHLVRSLVQMDDPDHRRYRAVTQPCSWARTCANWSDASPSWPRNTWTGWASWAASATS